MRVIQKATLWVSVAFLVFCAQAFAESIVFDTELLSINLVGSGVMPLSENRGDISTSIILTQSSGLASIGRTTAVGPNQGSQYQVQSYFDFFFDITFWDTDATVNFPGMQDGSSLTFTNNGPTHLETPYSATFDQGSPNYGLFPPPEANPYIGFFNFEIPLGFDLDRNGELDKIKIASGGLTVLEDNRTFITLPDGTVIDQFNTTLIMSGGVMDLSSDPPFGPITLTGPTTARSNLSIPPIPEPATILLLGLGLLSLTGYGRKNSSSRKSKLRI